MLHRWFARCNQFDRDGNGLKVHVDRVIRGIGKKNLFLDKLYRFAHPKTLS
jgi:hypothetical protein